MKSSKVFKVEISHELKEQNHIIYRVKELVDGFEKDDDRIVYFNRYFPNKVYFGFHNLSSKRMEQIDAFFTELENNGEIIILERQLKKIDTDRDVHIRKGKAFQLYNTMSEKLSEIQMAELLHLYMNQIGYSYAKEEIIIGFWYSMIKDWRKQK